MLTDFFRRLRIRNKKEKEEKGAGKIINAERTSHNIDFIRENGYT